MNYKCYTNDAVHKALLSTLNWLLKKVALVSDVSRCLSQSSSELKSNIITTKANTIS